MTTFFSDYYEKEIVLDDEVQSILFDMYVEVAENHNFEAEVSSPEDISDSSAFDHVMYHVEIYKNELDNYSEVSHLIEE